MEDIQSLRDQAATFRKAKQLQEALPFYQQLWEQHRSECTRWDEWGYAYCLQRTQQYEKGLEVCREAYPHRVGFMPLQAVYSQCIFHLEIARPFAVLEQDEARFFKAAQAITRLCHQAKFTIYTSTVVQVVRYLKKTRKYYPFELILEWLDKLSPDKLLLEPQIDAEGREHPSELAWWYKESCHALLEAKRYNECFRLGQEAFEKVQDFDTSSRFWICYWMAEARWKSQDLREALESFLNLLSQRDEWFVYRDIALVLHELGQEEQALRYAATSALKAGSPSFSLDLFYLIGQLLEKKPEYASQRGDFILLSVKVRAEKGWVISHQQSEELYALHLQLENSPSSEQLYERVKPLLMTFGFESEASVENCVVPSGE